MNKYTGSCHCKKNSWTYKKRDQEDKFIIKACNCSLCRKHGTLWAYGFENEEIFVSGKTEQYSRSDIETCLTVHFCGSCGCTCYWKSIDPDSDGKLRMAVNMRLIEDPTLIMQTPVTHFDGFDTFQNLGPDDRCVKDMWF